MGQQDAQQFMDHVRDDSLLYQEIVSTGNNMEAVIDLAKREGYDFTRSDFEAVLHEYGYEVGAELSDEDLESVAGGTVVDVGKPTMPNTNWPEC